MGGYLGYFVEWVSGVTTAVGDGFQYFIRKLTTDPLWGAGALGVVIVIAILVYLKRRASGGR
jgi:hypothetical protein